MSTSPPAAAWTRRSERGSLPLVRFMVWASLTLGRSASRVLLRAIAAYFLAFSGPARRASRDYLRRCLGREPGAGDLYRLFFAFASTVHDRLYFLKERHDLFQVEVRGSGRLEPGGMLLMGAHLGSFEAMRAAGRHLAQRQVAMAMFEENARRLNGVFAAINPEAMLDVVPLGHVDSMLALHARLEAGALVGVLADRTLGNEPVLRLPFLGAPAAFPTGPMRMAAALRQRVMFMAGLYRGANRYELHFEPLADFTALDGVPRSERERLVNEAVARYAARLEHFCRLAPDNWFNFHDFWAGP